MITLSYKNLRDPQFTNAFYKLALFNAFPTKVSIKVAKLKKAIDAESELAQTEFEKIVKRHAKLDEKGNLLPIKDTVGTFEIKEEEMDNWKKSLDEYNSVPFHVEQNPLLYSDLEGVSITPIDIIALEVILTEEAPIVMKPTCVKNCKSEDAFIEPTA